MTATDLLFVISFAIVIMWAGHWVKIWEGRALDRRLAEQTATILLWEALRRKLRENIREQLDYTFIMEFGKPVNPESDPTD